MSSLCRGVSANHVFAVVDGPDLRKHLLPLLLRLHAERASLLDHRLPAKILLRGGIPFAVGADELHVGRNLAQRRVVATIELRFQRGEVHPFVYQRLVVGTLSDAHGMEEVIGAVEAPQLEQHPP